MTGQIDGSEYYNNFWYLDSGASHHMTPNKNYFDNYEELKLKKYITIGDGTQLEAIGRGNIPIDVFVNGRRSSSEFVNVLHVPKLKCNLLSASTVTDK